MVQSAKYMSRWSVSRSLSVELVGVDCVLVGVAVSSFFVSGVCVEISSFIGVLSCPLIPSFLSPSLHSFLSPSPLY